MEWRAYISAANVSAAVIALAPYLAAAFFPEYLSRRVQGLNTWLRFCLPALLCLPYVLVTMAAGDFRWQWLVLYAALPPAVAVLLGQEAGKEVHGRFGGNWREFVVLAVLGLAVDLRWFEGAWPAHMAIFNKVILLDAGIYAFVLIRKLEGTGFDLRLRAKDIATGLRELAYYTPLALVLGLALGFLHAHAVLPGLSAMVFAWVFTFFFIAVPEELFFRGWLQNLLERSMGRIPALFLTSVLFGLAHFNKRAAYFNWRYVLLAALAGIFYGRAWRQERRVGAAAVTHASVDAIWSLWLK
jgi:membrane protease YdiL (CAAX protease family)